MLESTTALVPRGNGDGDVGAEEKQELKFNQTAESETMTFYVRNDDMICHVLTRVLSIRVRYWCRMAEQYTACDAWTARMPALPIQFVTRKGFQKGFK
jgi:hypothetical protein